MAGSAIILEWDTNTLFLEDETIYTSDDPEIAPQYHNQFFRAKQEHTSMSFATDFGNDLWEKMTVVGEKGETGAVGLQGPIGPQGPQGVPGVNGGDGADGIFTDIASQPEAEAGVDNVKGMTPLRTQQNFDFNIIPVNLDIGDNVADIAALDVRVSQNEVDISNINIDSAQITTNKNDIAGLVLVDDNLQSQIDAIVIDNAQITINQNDIATINTVEIPRLDGRIDALAGRVSSLESNFQLSNASGQQPLLNNQIAPIEILGIGASGGVGSPWILNSSGARSARVRAEIYRKDDAEERFVVANLEMHFLEGTNTWALARTWTTAFTGNPDGVNFSIVTTEPTSGVFEGQVSYISDDMVGGNYDSGSYIKFILEEISNTF